MKEGKRHGQGTMVWKLKDGDCKFEGEWEDDKLKEGTYTWPKVNNVETYYKGQFLNGKRHDLTGNAVLTYKDGGKY